LQYLKHGAVKKQARFKSWLTGVFVEDELHRVAKLQRGKHVLSVISAAIALCLILPKRKSGKIWTVGVSGHDSNKSLWS